ncbi:hypothetical protein Pmani_034270 [Petrolisthes manimaculis]|uniref:Uncharacterized protein n=1 Tax=Petrolisthes manimaculis TaxID=1843537 RepID=A0AAE1NPM2_9EUCA|nr:hypothetical protein Pmani_034270 [Petrolisthes manimaculis]
MLTSELIITEFEASTANELSSKSSPRYAKGPQPPPLLRVTVTPTAHRHKGHFPLELDIRVRAQLDTSQELKLLPNFV